MLSRQWWVAMAGAAGLALSTASAAKVSADEAAKLGKELTPVGATAAGNADGTVPEWIGARNFDEVVKGQTPQTLEGARQAFEKVRQASPGDFDTLLKYADTFNSVDQYPQIAKQIDLIIAKLPPAEQELAKKQRAQIGGGGKYEKPLFIITRDTVSKYAEHMTEGQKAMFAKYADYKMIVYPSLRNAYFPDPINAATIKNASSAELKGTDDVEGAVLGFPFPIPKSGAEIPWNHKMRYRGSAVRRYNNQAIVKGDGTYKISKLVEDVKFMYSNLREAHAGTKILLYYLSYSVGDGGLGITTSTAASIVGAYGGTVYLSTIVGGWVADRLLGPERVLF